MMGRVPENWVFGYYPNPTPKMGWMQLEWDFLHLFPILTRASLEKSLNTEKFEGQNCLWKNLFKLCVKPPTITSQNFFQNPQPKFWVHTRPITILNTYLSTSSIAIVQLISWWDAYDHLELFKKRRDLPNVIIESIHLYVQLVHITLPPYQTDEKSLEGGITGHIICFCLTSSPEIKEICLTSRIWGWWQIQ